MTRSKVEQKFGAMAGKNLKPVYWLNYVDKCLLKANDFCIVEKAVDHSCCYLMVKDTSFGLSSNFFRTKWIVSLMFDLREMTGENLKPVYWLNYVDKCLLKANDFCIVEKLWIVLVVI